MSKYFCPQCQELSLKSSVYPGQVTQRISPAYFDEDGNYHQEVVTNITQYSCTQGHTWSDTAKS